MKLTWKQRRLLGAGFILACVALIAWATIAVINLPCRHGSSELPFNATECPTLAEDLAPLLVALGLVIVAATVEFGGGQPAPTAFLLYAVVLASGKLALVGVGVGWQLYFLSMALSAPATFALHDRLMSISGYRRSRTALTALTGLAVLLALPAALPPYAALGQAWYESWRNAVRLYLVVSVLLSAALVISCWVRNRPDVRRRPIRLITYGNIIAFVPLFLLSLLPETVGLSAYVPYEATLFGLLMSPVFYAYALSHVRFERFGEFLQKVSIYYLLLAALAFGFLLEATALQAVTSDPSRSWLASTILLSAVLLVAMVPLRQRLLSLTNWVWYGRGPSYDAVARRLAEALSVTLDVDSLQGLLVHDLGRELRIGGSALYLRQSEDIFSLVESDGLASLAAIPSLPTDGALARFLQEANEPVGRAQVVAAMAEEDLSPAERAAVRSGEVGLWLPLVSGKGLHGLLLLGGKQEEDVFTSDDLRFLAVLIHQAGVAAHNVLLMDEVRQSQIELARAHQQLLVAGEQEQRRLAHELHDGPVQQLIGITYQLAQGRRQLERNGRSPLETSESLTRVLDTARQQLLSVVTELRTAIAALRPAGLEELGLAAALTGYVARLERERQGGAPRFELEFAEEGTSLPLPLSLCLFRVAQEAITNALKHSSANKVRLRFDCSAGEIELSVSDDGCGFVVPARLSELTGHDHFGLVTITERVAQVGGKLELRSTPGTGTTITVTVDREGVSTGYDRRD
ncbi:MAG: sensor histidine kinase [Anaerolineae bacterium]